MGLTLIRFLLLLSLSFTFGGFLFYASVVVPLGTQVLGSTTQGFVTREVTNVINIASVFSSVATLVFCWAGTGGRQSASQSSVRVPLICAVTIGVSAVFLIWLHRHLDEAMAEDEFAVIDAVSFYSMHRVYLWVSTIQWLASLPILWWFSKPITMKVTSDVDAT